MKLHEYQAKELFEKFQIPISPGKVATTAEEAVGFSRILGLPVVIKAQVHVGGRGKAGGVKVARTEDEVLQHASSILNLEIKGFPVKKVLLNPAEEISKENYVGFVIDREARKICLIASASGGMDIEKVADETPDKVAKILINPNIGIQTYHIKRALFEGQFDPAFHKPTADIIRKLYKCFIKYDCTLAEINPLAFLADGSVKALDGKMDLDDNGLYHNPELENYREIGSDLDEIESKAREIGVPYVHMPVDRRGPVGIMGNGAGLVMATVDAVDRVGAPYEIRPNNFLDVGGGSGRETIIKSMNTILLDETVQGIFCNIFGGISRCDEVARGLVDGVKMLSRKVPIVIRMTGTNEAEGKRILQEEGSSDIIPVDTMEDGAKLIVELVTRIIHRQMAREHVRLNPDTKP